MQVRPVLKVVAFGLLAYICIPPAALIWSMVLLNLRVIPPGIVFVSAPALFFILRFGLFVAAGFVVGKRVAGARIANATLAGLLLAIGVMLLDALGLFLLVKFRSRPYVPRDVPSGGLFIPIWAPWAAFGLQVALATVGGWIANRRRPGDPGLELPPNPIRSD